MIIASSILTSRKRSQAAIVINRNNIEAVGSLTSIIRRYPYHKVIKLQNALLLPGLVNVHTHLELPALIDAIRTRIFAKWVLNLIHAKKNLGRKDYFSAAKKNIELLIKTGTTTIGEICTHRISSSLLKKSGLRAVIFQEIIHMRSESDKSSKFKVQSPKIRSSSLISKGISPHSPYTVSEEALKKIKKVSENDKLRLCMHIAESKDELELLQRKKSGLERLYKFANWDIARGPKGISSFEYLNRIGLLSEKLLAVHAVQVTNQDMALIKKSGVSVAHCPRSNKELGVGRMPLKKFLDAGIDVGLGTDSLASSPTLNMWDEMRYAYQIHRGDGVTAEDIFRMATIGGAMALGLDKEIGTLEPGKSADIIAVPVPSKNTGNIYSDLLRETKSSILTMVNGKMLHLAPDVRKTA